jgi:hypothetical protein
MLIGIIVSSDSYTSRWAFFSSSGGIVPHPLDIGPLDVDNIDIGLEQGFDGSLSWIDSNGDRSENTSNQYSVSWFRQVDKFVIDTQGDSVGSLTIGNSVWRFLESNDLLVEEGGPVVDERHGALGPTDVTRTFVGFGNFSSVNVDLDGMLADGASEEAYCISTR